MPYFSGLLSLFIQRSACVFVLAHGGCMHFAHWVCMSLSVSKVTFYSIRIAITFLI